jgi:uncharacterized protein YbjT (DUF2867 family)
MIVVIGASGKVGSRVVRALRERDAAVRAVVRSGDRGAADFARDHAEAFSAPA